MKHWQTRVGDTLELPTANKRPEPIDLSGHPRNAMNGSQIGS